MFKFSIANRLVEIWAHQGKAKSAQKHKVMTDVTKLVFARSLLLASEQSSCRLILCFTDELAAHFKRGSWMAQAIKSAGIEIVVIDLPEELRERIRIAQTRQYR